MSNAIALRQVERTAGALSRIDNIEDLQTLAQIFVKSGFFQDAKDAAQAIVKVMAGAELGFPAIASMTGIYIVKGKVSMSANLMAAAIKRSGKYNYRVRQLDEKGCKIEFFEDNESVGFSEFTKADAQNAGLVSETWKKFFRNMSFARAMSNGAKWYAADIFGGPVYTPDELGAQVDGEGEVIEVSAEPTSRPVADEPPPWAGTACHEDDEPEPVRPVKLEGAQPTNGTEWPKGKGLGAAIFAKCKALGFTPVDLANYIQLQFKLAVPEEPESALDALDNIQLKSLDQALAGEFGNRRGQ